jgi:hypothetical protein
MRQGNGIIPMVRAFILILALLEVALGAFALVATVLLCRVPTLPA